MSNTTFFGDCRDTLYFMGVNGVSAQTCVTSPPYWNLRDYGVEGQLGQESTPEEYIDNLVGIFRAVREVLQDDGTLWLNLGDSYLNKRQLGLPWRVALALWPMAGICDKILSGTNPTLCLSLFVTDAPRRMSIFC